MKPKKPAQQAAALNAFLLSELRSDVNALLALCSIQYGDADEIIPAEPDLRGYVAKRVRVEGQLMRVPTSKQLDLFHVKHEDDDNET